MKRTLIALAVVLAGLVIQSPAEASPGGLEKCRTMSYIDAYVSAGDPVDAAEILASSTSYREERCKHNGLRLVKVNANTVEEVGGLHAMARDAAKHVGKDATNLLVCQTNKARGYVLDLAYYYYAGIRTLSKVELRDWNPWSSRFAEAHGCRVYVT
jgi:hypothetical protein